VVLENWTDLLIYIVPMLIVWGVYGLVHRRRQTAAAATLSAAHESGLTEPASLHPVIDPGLCLGCAVCVDACPEGEIIGLLRGKATLVEPTSCIGHGACRESCPQDAITLVLGTATRGVEIPMVDPDFQSNVPGIYVTGELGGMGLIRNAVIQGSQAVDAIAEARRQSAKNLESDADNDFDLLIAGAGPAGISASLRARELGLRCITIEQDTLGGTVAHYPRGKIVMTSPVNLPLFGKVNFRETSKEQLLELWTKVVSETGVEIRFEEELTAVDRTGGGFCVTTRRGEYRCANVLLAIGRRGTPRKLGVPGEEQNKVVYRLVAPEQYRGQRVLVVGGGDSAIEAALSLADEPGTETTLSYRAKSFSRAKVKNRDRVTKAEANSSLNVLLESHVSEIGERHVTLETAFGVKELSNDIVIVCAGGVLPTPLLRAAGIEIETRHGEV
jgi:thioredoxin reductase (NADPH)